MCININATEFQFNINYICMLSWSPGNGKICKSKSKRHCNYNTITISVRRRRGDQGAETWSQWR